MARASRRALFRFPDTVAEHTDITHYEVHGIDGLIGTVEAVERDGQLVILIVDTGFWIAGEKRLLPAGVVRGVTCATRTAFTGVQKDEVRNAPAYDEQRYRVDPLGCVHEIGCYYAEWAPLMLNR